MATPTYARSSLAVLSGLLLLTLPALSQQYNSNDVTPPNAQSGKLTSAGTGKQAGVDGNNHALLETGNAISATIVPHRAGESVRVTVSIVMARALAIHDGRRAI